VSEKYGVIALFAGVALVAAGYFWLLARAFRTRRLWGWGILLLPPLGLAFVIRHFRTSAKPLALAVAGGLVIGGTYGANYYFTHFVDLGPREKIVDGERHITLTGWDGTDYAVLRDRPDTVVLQMANPDVTDQTLENLRGMSRLRELDLNDTRVTDAGLQVLAGLPSLQILRLRNTQVTDQGFRDHLGDREALRELDLRETAVASKTLRAWKERRKDERKYLR
jgi:hypothetical protein